MRAGQPGEHASVAGASSSSASTAGGLKVARALEVFNAGEQPRRVAGVARSLGPPTVTVRPLEDSGSTVAIVVAWELCWYRYEVDLGDEAAGSQLVGQGMELDELPEEDRLANAAADERGELLCPDRLSASPTEARAATVLRRGASRDLFEKVWDLAGVMHRAVAFCAQYDLRR